MSTSSQHVAVVTGTSTGFGRLIAEILQRNGYRTYGTMRDIAGRNAQPKRELEAQGITVVELDVTDDEQTQTALAAVIAEAGHVDVLVNNAGVAFMGLTEAFTPEAVARQLDINVVGPLRVNRAILPSMRERKSGFVIYISSVVGRLVFPFNGVYTSSKWALEALAEATSYELRPSGIDVSIVEPGPYKTAIMGVIVGADDEDRKASYGETAAMGDRMMSGLGDVAGDPQEVADAVLALVQAAPGTRPLRKVVAPDPSMVAAVEGINASIEPTQLGLLEAWGLSALLPKKPAAV